MEAAWGTARRPCRSPFPIYSGRENDGFFDFSHCRLGPLRAQVLRGLDQLYGVVPVATTIVFNFTTAKPPVDLSAMEQVAAAAAAGLTEGTLAALVGQQAQALGAEQPCPDCGRPCPVGFEDRPLAVQGGRLTLHEPVCHCPDCERDFFPPADCPAPGQPRLQPPAAAEDR